jgi:hypothetical protein
MAINTYKYLKSVAKLVNHKLKRNGSDIVLTVNRENGFYHIRDNKNNLCHGGASSKSCVTFLRGIEYTQK